MKIMRMRKIIKSVLFPKKRHKEQCTCVKLQGPTVNVETVGRGTLSVEIDCACGAERAARAQDPSCTETGDEPASRRIGGCQESHELVGVWAGETTELQKDQDFAKNKILLPRGMNATLPALFKPAPTQHLKTL